MIAHLKSQKIDYHTYQTEEERSLRVVIKGVLENIPTEEVKLDLQELGFRPGRIYRMVSTRLDNKGKRCQTKNIVVNVPKTETSIYNRDTWST